MSSLICDRWLSCKLAMFVGGFNRFPGVLDSGNMTFGCGCKARLQQTSEEGAGGGGALQHKPGACHAAQYICTP